MSSSSGFQSEVSEDEIEIPISKRIGRLRKQNESTTTVTEPDSTIKPTTETNLPFAFDVNNFLNDEEEELISEPDFFQSGQANYATQDIATPSKVVLEESDFPTAIKETPQKRAPVSKKNLESIKKMTDSMVRTAPLAINEAATMPASNALNISGFLQRFEALKAKKTTEELPSEPAVMPEIEHEKVPQNLPKDPNEKYAELVNKIKAFSLKKHMVGPTVEIGKPRKKENKSCTVEKGCTLSQLNNLLIQKMSQKTQRQQVNTRIEKTVPEEVVFSTDESEEESEEEPIKEAVKAVPTNRVDINDSSLAETPSESSFVAFKEVQDPDAKDNLIFSEPIASTNNFEGESTIPLQDSTMAFPTSETSKLDQENQLLSSESSLDLLGGHHPSLSKPVLPINPGAILSYFEDPTSQTPEIPFPVTVSSPQNIAPDSENDSDEDTTVLKPKKREYHISDLASDDDMADSLPGLKRLVKKTNSVQMDSPKSDDTDASLSQIKNFVADQADEEDEHGELIAYSGSDEDIGEDEYDFDDLEMDFDGPVNQDAMRELHNKMMRDAENKGYKLLTRKDQTANRILGDDDGHQLARRQRNKNAFMEFEEYTEKKTEKIEECLIANYKSTAVNNINDLKLRISRNKSSRRTRSLQTNFTDAEFQKAFNDPNPRMALFRASLPSAADSNLDDNIPLVKRVLSRSSTIHQISKRIKPLTKSNSDSITIPSVVPVQSPFKSFLSGRSASNLSNSDPNVRAEHISQLKRQFDTKTPENQITKLNMTNARRFGYSSFKILGKRSALSDPKQQPK